MKKNVTINLRKAFATACVILLASAAWNVSAQPRPTEVTGTVVDVQGMPVLGATVEVQGTSIATATDGQGKFKILAPADAALVVSYIGYQTQMVSVSGRTAIAITLVEDAKKLEDIVIVGYGVQRKSDVTGAISSVKSEDLENRSITSVNQALAGKTSGVQVINTSGRPGASGSIRVRGFSSNSSSIGPLYIVDGLQMSDIGYLDPNNIESIEVLKDAASAAIYGAQAGNGVILVTTKSGHKADNGKIFYDMQYSVESLGNVPKFMQAQEYINYMYEGNLISRADIATKYDGHTNTNWADETFENGIMQRHTVGFMGGNQRGNLYVAITNLDNNGVVKGNQDFYKRLSTQINASYKIKKWLNVGTTNAIERYSYNSVSEGSEYGSLIASALVMDPLTPAYYTADNLPQFMLDKIAAGKKYLTDEYGRYYSVSQFNQFNDSHPLIQRDNHESTNNGINVLGTIYTDLSPLKGLMYTSKLGYRMSYSNSSNYQFPYYVDEQIFNNNYQISGTLSNSLYYQWENYVTYMFNLGEHNFTAMSGMSFIHSNSNYITGSGDELKGYEPNFRYLSYMTSGCNDSVSGLPSESASISYFGRLSWSFRDTYMLQTIFRADAYDSSKLAAKSRWGYFPSISAGWTISNENFMKDIDRGKLSFLKLRASWGQNGNVSVLSGYPYANSISVGGWSYQFDNTGSFTYGSAPSGLANPDLKWETSEQLDFGIDARFFRDRLTMTIDYFDKRTKDLLVSVVPPYETGATSVMMNAGNVSNRGFELDLAWRDRIGDWSYSASGNIATLRNKVTYLDPTVSRIAGARMHTATVTMFEKGHPVWYMYGYKFSGVDDATGNPIFVDTNKDGSITEDDKTDIGCAIPDFTYGLTLNVAYKGFDLTIFGSGAQGGDIWTFLTRTDYPKRNRLKLYYDERWTETNTTAPRPRPNCVDEDKYWYSDANIFDGSYFKIKQIQLGYTIPQSLIHKVAISDLRIYVSLDNWITFTSYPGFDPEAASISATSGMGLDKGSYPISKKLTFGLNLAF